MYASKKLQGSDMHHASRCSLFWVLDHVVNFINLIRYCSRWQWYAFRDFNIALVSSFNV